MAGLTFVNQVGAVEGMNQAAPGTLIPDTFVRFAQDVLFDRAGLIRRRGPFSKFDLYKTDSATNLPVVTEFTAANSDKEVILGVLSTYDPTGAERIGMLIHKTAGSSFSNVLRVFDKNFTYLGEEVLPFTAEPLSILTSKPALGGGLWVSLASDPSNPDTHYQFFWRGGYGSNKTLSITGDFDLETISDVPSEHKGIKTLVNTDSVSNLSVGQFVYAHNNSTNKDYYIGTIKEVDTSGTTFTLEKRPFIWDPVNVDNNHGISYSVTNAAWASNIITLTLNSTNLFEIGDVVSITGFTNAGYNNTAATITAIGTYTISYAQPTNPGSAGSLTNVVVKMDNDLVELNKVDVPLKFVSVRPYTHVHGRGLLNILDGDTTSITSGEAGRSGDGHWQAANVAGYNLYRASDNFYIGKISSITDNTTGFLYSDPGIKLEGEEYIMRSIDDTNLIDDFCIGSATNTVYNFAGLYSAVYAGYQWYGNFAQDDQNTNRVVFSASHDREAVDLSRDAADSIIFPGKSQFRGLGSSSAGLLVFLEDRTYILRGNDRTNFSVEQLVPEGCLSPSSIVEYGGGVFWAGKSGIMFFDGASVRNLTKDNLGLYYTDSLDVFNPIQDRVIGFIHKNNLVMHYTAWKSPFDPIRYEPIYVSDWESNPAYDDRSWDELDPAFTADDLNSEANVPIYWDQKKLNNPEESASIGSTILWKSGSQVSISNITSNGSTVTFTVPSGHGFIAGNTITVAGAPSQINGTYTISSVTSTTIVIASAVSVSGSSGFISTSTGVKWGDVSSINKYGPLRKNTSMTFAIYLPTNALTTISNMDPRGVASTETLYGIKTIVGVNSVEDHITFKVTNKSHAGTLATLTLSGGNTFSTTKSVVVDIGDPVFDGTHDVTAVTDNTISYINDSATVASTSVTSGTATEVFDNNLRARLIDIHPVFDTATNGPDDLIVEKINIPYSDLVIGPDFYIQTKHFTVGDPILRKWFQRVMISMLLYDGAMRMDLVDDDDNDSVNIAKKKHQYWELFTETGYDWDYLGRGDVPENDPTGQVQFGVVFPKLTSPAKSTWNNVEGTQTFWEELFTSDFNRYSKRFSWRYPSVGFRLYQLNNYKKPFNGVVTTPTRVEVQGFSIGFKALRQGRV